MYYIDRNYQKKENILLQTRLCCYPPENEAAKIYSEFMIKHPELSTKDVDCRIYEEEREEDHYGNGGGVDHTLIIFTKRDETEVEYNERIKKAEDEYINDYFKKISSLTSDLLYQLNIRDIPNDDEQKYYKDRIYVNFHRIVYGNG